MGKDCGRTYMNRAGGFGCGFLAEKYQKAVRQSEGKAASHERMAGMTLKVVGSDHKANAATNYCAGSSCARNRKAA